MLHQDRLHSTYNTQRHKVLHHATHVEGPKPDVWSRSSVAVATSTTTTTVVRILLVCCTCSVSGFYATTIVLRAFCALLLHVACCNTFCKHSVFRSDKRFEFFLLSHPYKKKRCFRYFTLYFLLLLLHQLMC